MVNSDPVLPVPGRPGHRSAAKIGEGIELPCKRWRSTVLHGMAKAKQSKASNGLATETNRTEQHRNGIAWHSDA